MTRRGASALLPLLALAAPAFVLLAHPAAHAQSEMSSSSDPGRETFLADCAYCHGTDLEGTDRGPQLRTVGAADVDFYVSTGRMPIQDPSEDPEPGQPRYADRERAALVAYISTLQSDGPEIPAVDAAAGSLSDGETLYSANCAACHGPSAAGGALTSGEVAPSLKQDDDVEIAEAVRVGPGTMPVFGTETLDDVQLDSIVRYAAYLRNPDDRGGAGLGGIGPIGEGFVAALGLVAMLVIARLIGSRADE